MRRLPGPAGHRLGDGGDSRGSLRVVSGLAENTNSIFCDSSSELEAANGCPVLLESRNHQLRSIRAQLSIPIRPTTRSPARLKKTRAFLLTKTGSKIIRQAGSATGSTLYPSILSFRIMVAVRRCWDCFETAGPRSSYGTQLCKIIQIK